MIDNLYILLISVMYLSVDIASHSSRDANIYRFIIIQLAFANFTSN